MWPAFFFQAEDGIRDGHVTGVQTCALPICLADGELGKMSRQTLNVPHYARFARLARLTGSATRYSPPSLRQRMPASMKPSMSPSRIRSEERRVGKVSIHRMTDVTVQRSWSQ